VTRIKVVMPVIVVCCLLTFSGCATYKITHDLEQPIDEAKTCSIGEIKDELPLGFKEEDKPSLEKIDMFRDYLRIKLMHRGVFNGVGLMSPDAEYEVIGGLLEFRKGSDVARFFIGLGVGNARLTVRLSLVDRATGEVLFSGTFKQEVSSWVEEGDLIFERAADAFSKALERQIKKLEKKKENEG
jgi:hypothetical protein